MSANTLDAPAGRSVPSRDMAPASDRPRVVTGGAVRFRDDINGLRAVAVAAVLLFHFRLPGFEGGFAGVDVFYVLSGFLMTEIIDRRMTEGRFSLARFFADRVRRIVPALAIMAGVLLVAGVFIVDPFTYTEMAREISAALLFVSNIYFFQNSGYFDDSAVNKWMLHTWSTSLECQFYILYPIGLALLKRFGASRRLITVLVAVGAAASLGVSAAAPVRYAAFDFYLLPTRFWEMAAGALVSLMVTTPSSARISRMLHYGGLAVIVASTLALDTSAPWPSWRALLPVVGTAAVLAGRAETERWAGWPPVRALGTWSYSLYVWHWPVVVALVYAGVHWSLPLVVAALAGVLGLGAVSYHVFEQPFRVGFKAQRPPHRSAFVLGGIWAAVLAGGLIVAAAGGFPARRGAADVVRDARAASADWKPPAPCGRLRENANHVCHVGPPTHDMLLVGDSHAEMLFPHLASRLAPGRSLTTMTFGGCAPLILRGVPDWNGCRSFVEYAYDAARVGRYRTVVVGAYWLNYLRRENKLAEWVPADRSAKKRPAAYAHSIEELTAWLAALKAGGADVVLMLPFPSQVRDVPMERVRARFFRGETPDLSIGRRAFEQREAQVKAMFEEVARKSGARLVDPVPAVCGPAICPVLAADGTSLYRDSNHVRASVSAGPYLDFLDSALASPPPTAARGVR